jgi:hypothetical protein
METSTGLQCFNLLFPALSGHKGRLKHGSACKKGKGNEHCTGRGTTMMGISTMQIVRSLSRFLEVNPQVLSFNYNMFFLHATHCYALPCSYVWQLRSQRGKYCLHWRPQDTPTIRSFSSDNFDIANVHISPVFFFCKKWPVKWSTLRPATPSHAAKTRGLRSLTRRALLPRVSIEN